MNNQHIPAPEQIAPGPRVLRVFFDHGHEWPLWETGTWKYTMEPTDYGFSAELIDLMRRWYEAWYPIASYDIDQPVPEPTDADRAREADLERQVVAVIRREIPPDVTVDASTRVR